MWLTLHDGSRFACSAKGDGPTLLLLHAGIADRRMWAPQLDVLASATSRRIVAPDQRGFGDTGPATRPFRRADDVRALADALSPDAPVDAVGASMAGRALLDAALAAPGRFRTITLIGAAPGGFATHWTGPDEPIEQAIERAEADAVASGDVTELAELEVRLWIDGTGRDRPVDPAVRRLVVAMNRRALDHALRARAEEMDDATDTMVRLDRVEVPTLVIVGRCDTAYARAAARALAEGIPGARSAEIPGCAHLPSLEDPAAVHDVLVPFLAGG